MNQALTEPQRNRLQVNPQHERYFRYIIYRLHFNPTSIISAIFEIKSNISLFVSEPIECLEKLFISWILPDGQVPQVSECVKFVENLIKKLSSERVKTSILFGLGAPTNCFSSGFLKILMRDINRFCAIVISPRAVEKFIEETFVSSGWIEQISVVRSSQEDETFYFVHPILTNSIRALEDTACQTNEVIQGKLDSSATPLWRTTISQQFYLSVCKLVAPSTVIGDSEIMQINTANCYSALTFYSKNIDGYLSGNLKILMSAQISLVLYLWKQSEGSESALLPYEILLSHTKRTIEQFGRSQYNNENYGSFAPTVKLLCAWLSLYYITKEPKEALKYIFTSMRISLKILRQSENRFPDRYLVHDLSLLLLSFAEVSFWMAASLPLAKAAAVSSISLCSSLDHINHKPLFFMVSSKKFQPH